MKKRILVVDDEETLLTVITKALEREGYDVTATVDSHQALSDIAISYHGSNPYHLLITDMKMPGMSGMELVAAINNGDMALPILAITGCGDKKMVMDLMRLGCADYMDKPFTVKEIAARVKTLLAAEAGDAFEEQQEPAKETVASIGDSDDWRIIKPDGAGSHELADSLRVQMVQRLDEGVQKFRFDFSDVETVDVVMLTVLLCFGRMLSETNSDSSLEMINVNSAICSMFKHTGVTNYYVIPCAEAGS